MEADNWLLNKVVLSNGEKSRDMLDLPQNTEGVHVGVWNGFMFVDTPVETTPIIRTLMM
jgi:hypothetical protein